MNTGRNDDSPQQKRPYQSPSMVVVALRPDEAVLGACKTASASGPGTRNNCNPGICRSRGS